MLTLPRLPVSPSPRLPTEVSEQDAHTPPISPNSPPREEHFTRDYNSI
ncbi:hypothetical protein CWATWH0401_2873 [Crocosphaera watsonii WH 0401]|uniref:Uncharacterized protein n=1 Tax=Crocosphaera watsonii WH 0401 TaxID=555881 RepID=T2JDS8_CROWT|nr:hypothetical protein CWATWH0401_2873 [Crocosphaera watsonii WH 0401]